MWHTLKAFEQHQGIRYDVLFLLIERSLADRIIAMVVTIVHLMTVAYGINRHSVAFLALHKLQVLLYLTFPDTITFLSFAIVKIKRIIASIHQVVNIVTATPVA